MKNLSIIIRREISFKQGEDLANDLGIKFVEASAKTGNKIREVTF